MSFYLASKHGRPQNFIIESDTSPNMRDLGLSMLSRAFDTKKELLKEEAIREEPCKVCGGLIKTDWLNYKNFEEHCICFSCNHWNEIFLDLKSKRRLIISGTSYYVSPDNPGAYFQGHGGREFKIKRFDSDEIITTRNLWCQGDIPDEWKDMIPDNAKFV